MKLVMTLRARDEADIVDAQIAFHLNAGVDFVIATDNLAGRHDRDPRVVRASGKLHLIREGGDEYEAEWATRMAASLTEFGADWVIHE